MANDEFSLLIGFIGALRAAKSGDPLTASVVEESPQLSSPIAHEVRARTPGGGFECRSTGLDMTYVPGSGTCIVAVDEGDPEESPQANFPWEPPVLAMFSPLDLPIWGGPNDNHTITGIRQYGAGLVRIDFGHQGDPHNADSTGFAIVDLPLGIATQLQYNGRSYTTSSVVETPRALYR